MQPVLSARAYRLWHAGAVLWILMALEALPGLYLLLIGPEAVQYGVISGGNVIVPSGAALLTVAYDCTGQDAGELRNCLCIGRSRLAAYLAPLLVLSVGVLLLAAAYYAPYVLAGTIFGWACDAASVILLMSWCVASSICLLCAVHAIVMQCSRTLVALIAVAAFLFAFVLIATRIQFALQQPPMVSMYTYDPETGAEVASGMMRNPDYPTGARRDALRFWIRALPTAGMATDASDEGFWMGAGANALLFTVFGFLAFRRRNLS